MEIVNREKRFKVDDDEIEKALIEAIEENDKEVIYSESISLAGKLGLADEMKVLRLSSVERYRDMDKKGIKYATSIYDETKTDYALIYENNQAFRQNQFEVLFAQVFRNEYNKVRTEIRTRVYFQNSIRDKMECEKDTK